MNSYNTIAEAIAVQCRERPDAIAIVHDNQDFTYQQLDSYSSTIAAKLAKLSVSHADSVALCVDRSIHAIAAMMGVFKVGAAFVPIDPSFPEDRIAYMLEDASASVVLCDSHYAARFNMPGLSIEKLPSSYNNLAVEQHEALPLKPEDRAYIMYTSGSTGKPKGVPICHRALLNYCVADAEVYALEQTDRTLQFSTLSFDIAIEEIFPPLLVGSTVVIRPSERSEAQIELSDIVEKYGITALHMATGYWHEWVDLMNAANMRVAQSIRLMVVTGEKVSPEHYHRWNTLVDKPVLWANAYGPTEATVTATVFIPPENWQGKALPIGKPLLNYTAYILDDNKKMVPPGDTGELFIGGPSLADGYLNRPDLTEKAFFPDPFSDTPGAQMYRTGDLARWMDDGNIDYAGRIDHQIKVGSYRIEPGEIENAINEHAEVKEVLVVADETDGKKKLLAYVASDNQSLTANDVVEFLQQSLPIYMVPSRYVLLTSLPKTLNGKIDRKALPDSSHAVAPRGKDYKAPEGEVQTQLCQIWSDVLGVPEVGVEDSFISMGGDSLMAVRSIARIQNDLDFTISTRDFFYLDTVALLAGYIEGKAVARVVPAPIPYFVTARDRQIYTLTQPAKESASNGVGVLFVPPVGSEQRRTQRPLRILMQNLARQGFTTQRFDWHGTANSSHDSGELQSIDQWSNDVQDAAEHLAKSCDQINVVGIRLGALIASNCALSGLPISNRIYWDPVFSGQQFLSDLTLLQRGILRDVFRFLRVRKAGANPMIEFAGLHLSVPMQNSIAALDFADLLRRHEWNNQAQLIINNSSEILKPLNLPVKIHTVDEQNDWVGHRSTTSDMQINQAASILADVLNEQLNAPSDLTVDQNVQGVA